MSHLTACMPETEPSGGSAAPTGESSIVLLGRLENGDGEALSRLVQRYLPPLLRWARGRLPVWACDNSRLPHLVRDALIDGFQRLAATPPSHEGAIQAHMREALMRRITDELRH